MTQNLYSSQHDEDDFDALLAQRRRDAGLPEMHAETFEAWMASKDDPNVTACDVCGKISPLVAPSDDDGWEPDITCVEWDRNGEEGAHYAVCGWACLARLAQDRLHGGPVLTDAVERARQGRELPTGPIEATCEEVMP